MHSLTAMFTKKTVTLIPLLAATLSPAHGLTAHERVGSAAPAFAEAGGSGAQLDEPCEVCRATRSGRAVVVETALGFVRVGETLWVALPRGVARAPAALGAARGRAYGAAFHRVLRLKVTRMP